MVPSKDMRDAGQIGGGPGAAHGQYSFMFEQQDTASVKTSSSAGSSCKEQNEIIKTQACVTPIDTAVPQSGDPQRIPNWLQQTERFLRVIVRIYLGLLVCLAPWYSPVWEANPLFQSYPDLVHWISYGAVRGVVSGLGLLNLWIALGDVLRPLRIPSSRKG